MTKVIFISDVHLIDENDTRGKFFCEVLESIVHMKVSVLILGGDIFDFFIGYTEYYHKKYERQRTSTVEIHTCVGFAIREA